MVSTPPCPHAPPCLQVHSWDLQASTRLAGHHGGSQGQGFALIPQGVRGVERTSKARLGTEVEGGGLCPELAGAAELKP